MAVVRIKKLCDGSKIFVIKRRKLWQMMSENVQVYYDFSMEMEI